MSTVKSSTEHLTLNADGFAKNVYLQRNGTTTWQDAILAIKAEIPKPQENN